MKELSDRSANFTDSVIRRMTRVAKKYDAYQSVLKEDYNE